MNLQFPFMVSMVAGWMNRQQQATIGYLMEEKQVLIEQLGGAPQSGKVSARVLRSDYQSTPLEICASAFRLQTSAPEG